MRHQRKVEQSRLKHADLASGSGGVLVHLNQAPPWQPEWLPISETPGHEGTTTTTTNTAQLNAFGYVAVVDNFLKVKPALKQKRKGTYVTLSVAGCWCQGSWSLGPAPRLKAPPVEP